MNLVVLICGGPLSEPMCYAQIGGLSVATFITLLLVPVIYAIFVFDLKLLKWGKVEETTHETAHQPAQFWAGDIRVIRVYLLLSFSFLPVRSQ